MTVLHAPEPNVGGGDPAMRKNRQHTRSVASSRAAKNALANVRHGSLLVTENNLRWIPSFHCNEVKIGKLLGRGGFNDVLEVQGIAAAASSVVQKNTPPTTTLHPDEQKHAAQEETSADMRYKALARDYLASTCVVNHKTSKGGRFAIKCIRKTVFEDDAKYLTAVKDIVTETHLLSSLDHPNIMKVRGIVSCESSKSTLTGQDAGYLIIMDRLFSTLSDKFDAWRTLSKSMLGKFGKRKKVLFCNKVKLAYDLSEVFHYLHEKNVFYRDIKLENIGFDVHGDVKVFDFGLSKELRSHDAPDAEGLYLMSTAGAPRYMSPEIFRGERCNLSSDVYSYGILLWEMFTLKKAFEGWPLGKLKRHAHGTKAELKIPPSLSPRIKALIEDSFSFHWKARPTFAMISNELKKEMKHIGCDVSSNDTETIANLDARKRRHAPDMMERPHKRAAGLRAAAC